jgi:hypothetical protein
MYNYFKHKSIQAIARNLCLIILLQSTTTHLSIHVKHIFPYVQRAACAQRNHIKHQPSQHYLVEERGAKGREYVQKCSWTIPLICLPNIINMNNSTCDECNYMAPNMLNHCGPTQRPPPTNDIVICHQPNVFVGMFANQATSPIDASFKVGSTCFL